MSVNSSIHRDFIPELEGFKLILARYLGVWRNASTLDARIIAEADIVELFKEVITYSYELEETTARQHLDAVDLNSERQLTANLIILNAAKLRSIAKLYLEYFNSQQEAIAELIGLLRRGKQTLSTLRLWDRTLTKWVISEAFVNFDNLDTNFTSLSVCDVNTSAGHLTLPLETTGIVAPATVAISSESNGFTGNSDAAEVTTNNILPLYAFDGSVDTWFEYEKMDSGPLKLNLICQLRKADIVNGLLIEALNLGEGMDFVVTDVLFNSVSGKTWNLSELLSPGLPDDFNVVKTIGNDTFWEIAHLPVQCKSVTIKLEQENSYFINVTTRDERLIQRPRYAIGIKKIEFKKHKYKSSGGINSTMFGMMPGIYAAAATANVYPRNQTLFSANLNVSVDGAENWVNDVLALPETQGDTVLCDGEEFDFAWSLKLVRNDDVFPEATSFTDEEAKIETSSILRRVSPQHSPAEFQLSERPYNKEVFVIQPKAARKISGSSEALDLGIVSSTAQVSLPLPFSIIDEGLDPSKLRVYARRQELTLVKDIANLSSTSYFITPDYKYITLRDIEPGSMIKFAFDLDRLLFEERSDGYYAEFDTLFDPDVDNINLVRLLAFPVRKSMVISPGKLVIRLGYKNLSEFELKSENGTAYTLAANYAALSAPNSTDDYFIDMVNGVLYFRDQSIAQSDNIKAVFMHSTDDRLDSDSFSVWFDKIRPTGIIVRPEAMVLKKVTENPFRITAPLQQRINPVNGELETKTDLFPGELTKYTLSYEYLVKGSVVLGPEIFNNASTYPAPHEVEYVDGYSEFLGLLQMEREVTAEIETTINPLVEFKLAAGAAVYLPLGVGFSDTSVFVNQVDLADVVLLVGNYHISSSGLVTVNIGTNSLLPSNISLHYSYRDPTFDEGNRFSIDYARGLLFLSENILSTPPGGTPSAAELDKLLISYKVAGYTVGYDVAIENNNYAYTPSSNSVTVRTENMKGINKQIKIIWGKPPKGGEDLTELADYFSPIINNIGIRFT